ncbi:PFGI-1 class ICE element type IV pilus protein PilL2 [Brenneria izbisi]|uniref:TcpQ domain-containing protein n=1 Tax=Brenneria izbisi TaxID=2939450 RepID=A0AA41XYY5_9GAMM|nr:TcpQ domain-containing protein [Brenneria izbisi]MCV9879287.1 TcpQ domain-containing protein [Brenneria izbisi]MCV9883877.1 TcpQ domain-containing protein [Brenneria izbisi]
MARPTRQPEYKLACLTVALLAAGCVKQNTTPSDVLPRANVSPRVNDIYQNRSPEVVRYDRYTLVSTRPADSQRDPLNQMIDISMPQQLVRTVGDGFRYLLLESGYSLCPSTSIMFTELLSRPLPGVQRSIGPVRLSEALQVVAGPAWRLRVDDVNREVCFILRDEYRSFSPVIASVPPVQPKSAEATAASMPQSGNPFTGGSSSTASGALNPDSQPLPSPVLTTLPTSQNTGKGNTSIPPATASGADVPANKPVSAKLPPATANVAPVNGQQHAKVRSDSSSLAAKPVTTSLPPAPAAQTVMTQTASPSVPASSAQNSGKSPFIPGKPISVQPLGTTWRAEVGTTLRESLNKWASDAQCVNGGNWVVVWPVSLDYRIDAPLSFHGNFESAVTQVFDLYRNAEKPLFSEANRIQCLIFVSDRPGERR